MSVEFTLTDNKLSLDEWKDLLGKWADKQSIPFYEQPEFVEGSENQTAHLWAEGSTRGAFIFIEKNEVTLRLNSLSSRSDWSMGFSIFRTAIKSGGGTLERENGDTYGIEKLNPDQASADAVNDFCFSCNAMRKTLKDPEAKSPAQLPLGIMNLTITEDDLPQCSQENVPAIEKNLADRVKKYGTAYRGNVMGVNKVKLSTWALIPTMVSKVDFVTIDYNDITVPLHKIKDVLGPLAEAVDDTWTYLPELDAKRDKEILDRLAQESVAVEELGNAEPTESKEDEENLSEELIRTCVKSIVVSVFSNVDPEDQKKKMVEAGVPKEMIDGLFLLTAQALQLITQNEKDLQQVYKELQSQDVPDEISLPLLEGIGDAFQEMGDE